MFGKKWWPHFRKFWVVAGPGLGVLVGLFLNHRQATVAEKTYDRSSGRIEARLGELQVFPNQAQMDARYRISEGPFKSEIRFSDIDQLLTVNPVLSVKNTGQEPIDAIKVEVEGLFGVIDAIGLPPELQRAKTPWAFKQSDVVEFVLNEKLRAGHTATVSILTGLVNQMVQVQAKDARNTRDHLGTFEVSVYARAVGTTSYDGFLEKLKLRFVWVPSGFSDEKTRPITDTMKAKVIIQ